jgi:hypothetical protein
VNAAVQDYNATLDRYFEELAGSSDPASIVARAEALPAPPDLDAIRAQARARAVSQFAEREDEQRTVEAAPVAEAAPVVEPAAAAEPSMAETSIPTIGAVAEESEPVAEAMTPVEPVEKAEPVVAESIEPPIRAETVLIGDTPPEQAPAATSETPSEPRPVPVMDPAATANSAWPTPVQEPLPASEPEPEPVAASVDHTSAAVRLLRSVAPWTAPTHAGSNDRSDNE